MFGFIDGCSGVISREQTSSPCLAGDTILASESSQQTTPWSNSSTAVVFSPDMPRDLEVILRGDYKNKQSENRHVLQAEGGQDCKNGHFTNRRI
jgi:hypothetical protein